MNSSTSIGVSGARPHSVGGETITVDSKILIFVLTFTLLTWIIWRGPNIVSRWQMGFNFAFKGLSLDLMEYYVINCLQISTMNIVRVYI